MNSGCFSSPCAFGCSPVGNTGFSCGCPNGYQRIAQGHCISTITPVSSGYGGDLYGSEYGPNGLDPYNQSKDKIISTEGCYACKGNGRGKRNAKAKRNATATAVATVEASPPLVLNASTPLLMQVPLDQTKHRMRIIQLQPALRSLKNHVEYEIVKGNEADRFEIVNKRGVWSLHFRRRLKEPAHFKLEIRGVADNGLFDDDPIASDESLDLNVRIHVVNN